MKRATPRTVSHLPLRCCAGAGAEACAEAWAPARPGFPDYLVSSLGRVWNVRTGRAVRPYANAPADGSPYPRVTLHAGRYRSGPRRGQLKRAAFYAHRLTALAHVPGRTRERWQVHHVNGDTYDTRASNLQWTTPAENAAARGRQGRIVRAAGAFHVEPLDTAELAPLPGGYPAVADPF